jgi:predicted PurR-regulated permease PerM
LASFSTDDTRAYFIIALLEFVWATTILFFLGVPFSFLLAGLIALFVFIPGLGPAIVWVPLVIYYGLTGQYFVAIAILVMGAVVSFGMDGLLRAKIVGAKANIHPLIMLTGVIGGIAVFGIMGFIIGPLVLSYTIKLSEELLNS